MADKRKNSTSAASNAVMEAKRYASLALRTLAAIARDTKSPATARVAAASKLLERGFGRAGQGQDIGPSVGDLDDETLRRLIAQSDHQEDNQDNNDGA